MKKYGIFALLLLVATFCGLGVAYSQVNKLADDVTITETVQYGDKKEVAGLTVTTQSVLSESPLHWETTYTLGEKNALSCNFSYEKKDESKTISSSPDISFFAGPDDDEWWADENGEEVGCFSEEAVKNVIDKTKASSTYKETVLLNDYMKYYAISLSGDFTDELGIPVYVRDNGDAGQYFKIPIIENSLWTVKVKKDQYDEPYSVDIIAKKPTQIKTASIANRDAAYLFVTDMTVYDKKQKKSERVPLPEDICGLHRIPYSREQAIGTYYFDFSKAELVLPMEQGKKMYGLELVEDKNELRYFEFDGCKLYYVIMDLTSYKINQRIYLPYTFSDYIEEPALRVMEKNNGNQMFIALDSNEFCFLVKDSSGTYQLITADTFLRKNPPGWAYPYEYIDWIYQDDNLIIGALYGKSEDSFTASCSYQVSSYRKDKLVYLGFYESSLDSAIEYEDYTVPTIEAQQKNSIVLTMKN